MNLLYLIPDDYVLALILFVICASDNTVLVCQVSEPQVSRLCMEAEEFIAMGKWLELATLMITSAELIFSKISEKGRMLLLLDIYSLN